MSEQNVYLDKRSITSSILEKQMALVNDFTKLEEDMRTGVAKHETLKADQVFSDVARGICQLYYFLKQGKFSNFKKKYEKEAKVLDDFIVKYRKFDEDCVKMKDLTESFEAINLLIEFSGYNDDNLRDEESDYMG